MRTGPAFSLLAFTGALTLASCSPTKRVPEGHYLLERNVLKIHDAAVPKDALEPILKQKPNKRILFFRFYLQAYNLPDPERIPQWREEKNARRDRLNERRKEHGKAPKPYKPTRAEWLRDVVGEAPAILDSALTRRSADQLRLYLHKEGWFDARVSDTTIYRGRKAVVTYRIAPGEPYRLHAISDPIDDPMIRYYVRSDSANSVLHIGDRFSAEALDRERLRVADLLKEEGYLFYSREWMFFDADTSAGVRKVDLRARMAPPGASDTLGILGTPQGRIWYVDSVTVNMSRRDDGFDRLPRDTVHYDGYAFIYNGSRPEFKPKALSRALTLPPGERFRQSRADRTYRRLTNLRVFDRVDITYDTLHTRGNDRVNCTIDLLPSKRQGLSSEGFLTNRGGLLGTSVGLTYKHRNLFRSMAALTATVNLGFEAQRNIVGASDAETAVGEDVLFNTLEVGPEVSLRLPKALMIDRWFKRSNDPRTTLTALFNYQRRPDYTRTLMRGSFGWAFSETAQKTWTVIPVEMNLVRIPEISTGFASYLAESNDPVLRDSYTDHVILNVPKVTYTLNTQGEKKQRNVLLYQAFAELAGSALHAVNRVRDSPLTTDTAGNRFDTFLGVRYAEYAKMDNDLRYYHSIHEKSSLAFRLAFGAARPYGNLEVMPFETSFFVGGANGLRAWRARTVGPGSYDGPLLAFDRTGEIRLEGNAEYRFKLVGYFEGALFADFGNVWNWEDDPERPGSGIETDLLSELAIGSGVGARLNFDFFIIRFDLGLQMKDPGRAPGQRWIFEPKDAGYDARFGEKLNFNLGIGYPF